MLIIRLLNCWLYADFQELVSFFFNFFDDCFCQFKNNRNDLYSWNLGIFYRDAP